MTAQRRSFKEKSSPEHETQIVSISVCTKYGTTDAVSALLTFSTTTLPLGYTPTSTVALNVIHVKQSSCAQRKAFVTNKMSCLS